MKKIKLFAILMACVFMLPGLSSCGGGGSSSDNDSEYYDDETEGYSINPNSETSVRNILANHAFTDNEGNTISFRGNRPMTVEFNGSVMANDIDVTDYGFDSNGGPYAVISVGGPYGHTSLFLTELDSDFGGRLKSKIVIFDVNDRNNMFYKTR